MGRAHQLLLSAALLLPVAALAISTLSAPMPACRLQVIPDYDLKFAYQAVLQPSPGCREDDVLRVRKSSTTSVKRNGARYQPIKPDGTALYGGQYSWRLGKRVFGVPTSELWIINSWRWEYWDPEVWNPRTQQKGRWAAGEVLRDLVYAFSHDLRTPLLANGMNMRSALAGAYGELPAEYRANLQNGLAANETLLALADQLLLVAKYESGENAQDDTQSVNLRDLVVSVLSDLKPRAQAKALTFDTALSGVTVQGRKHDLRRAVQNLLDNAVKFSPPDGTVWVTLSAEYDEAVLTVRDQGRGVSAEQQARLFQRFRGSGAGSGSGLGLYLTRRIAEAHGGSVRYHRRADARSEFTLTLPRGTP
ncbi:sensor histidine kinase KdpD [Deinococcus sp.]|uniref:sensor histidine kinase n=1 Tax=Deinococcus sp. TaxID=47478 RepID=UPI0025BB5441|nr:HAMP domain-containing sensor histidine kinase [Deinococcus sp.]